MSRLTLANIRTRRRGFTLIEAMMATVVLSFCVVGLAGVLVASATNSAASTSNTQALEVARTDMETLLSNPLSHISPAAGASTTEIIPANALSATTLPITHTGQVRYISRSATQNARDIAIITTTATIAGGETVTLSRLVTRAEASQ